MNDFFQMPAIESLAHDLSPANALVSNGSDDIADIAPMMNALGYAAMTGTDFAAPINTSRPFSKVAHHSEEESEPVQTDPLADLCKASVTITAAPGSPLAKRDDTAERIDLGDGTHLEREYNAKGELIKSVIIPDGSENEYRRFFEAEA